MFLKNYFQNTKISTKFNLLVILMFVTGIFLSGSAFWGALERRAEVEVSSKASILIETINGVRNYTQDRVRPLLKERIETETQFTPETVPNFAAREVFEYFRKNPDYQQYLYKDAALDPTNPKDKANDFETKLLEEFQTQGSSQKTGWYDEFSYGKVFYVARPLSVTKQSCLECHSSPSKAPESLLKSYGEKNGFGWELNQVVAAQVVYIPAEEILKSVRRSFTSTMGILAVTFIVIIVALNFLLKRFVIRRIQKIARIAKAISLTDGKSLTEGNLKVDFKEDSKDEIGLLVNAFNRMKSSVIIGIQMCFEQEEKNYRYLEELDRKDRYIKELEQNNRS